MDGIFLVELLKQFASGNGEFIAVALPLAIFAADILVGRIPDRHVPYIGLARRIFGYISSRRGKKDGG